MQTKPATLLNNDHCWQAVQNREASLAIAFFYGVRSTGIYCRPSCPSRRPRRDQVQFFAAADDAEAAGFRACLRCRPREAAAQVEAMANACRYIETHLEDDVSLAALSAQADLSPAHFQRVFRRTVGVSPREYIAARRLEQFKAGLQNGEPVTSALIDAGYSSASRLYEQAPLGMTPRAYKRGGEQKTIHYTLTDTPLGQMLVAATEQGLCAVTLGDSAGALEAALRREYPAALIAPDDAGLAEWAAALVRHLAGGLPHLDLPLDVQATAWQRRVWQELRAIPYGETRSYRQVAEAVHQPAAARAVAQACAANPTAIVIPCHRVVRGDGALSGYRWGVSRKRALLEQEKIASQEEM